jgi:hypothetical protein
VIHAQGARIRAQGAPGYVHKEQAYKQDDCLTGVFTSQKGNSTSESGSVRKRSTSQIRVIVLQRNLSSESSNSAPARFEFRFADGVKHVNLMTFTKHLNARF